MHLRATLQLGHTSKIPFTAAPAEEECIQTAPLLPLAAPPFQCKEAGADGRKNDTTSHFQDDIYSHTSLLLYSTETPATARTR